MSTSLASVEHLHPKRWVPVASSGFDDWDLFQAGGIIFF